MKKIREYIKESFIELMTKVTWPTWQELQSSAIIVFVASLIIAMLIWGMDISFSSVLKEFYHLFS